MIFTTSWDDGYASDLRIADVLEKYGAKGTFYVCPQDQHEQNMLTEKQMRELSTRHELGAHTMKHPRLAKIDPVKAEADILESKKWIESVSGKQCDMFCYPYGSLNSEVKKMVNRSGFTGARTTSELQYIGNDPYELPVSIHLYPMPMRPKFSRWWHFIDLFGPIRFRWKRLNEIGIPVIARRNWQSLARALFIKALENDEPFFHLWGHAHELDGYKKWDELESFLAFVAEHDVTHATNSELIASLQST
jgi:peptidoglycan-N-acetylglucosamine deacetylase